jgi:hypothetical protein
VRNRALDGMHAKRADSLMRVMPKLPVAALRAVTLGRRGRLPVLSGPPIAELTLDMNRCEAPRRVHVAAVATGNVKENLATPSDDSLSAPMRPNYARKARVLLVAAERSLRSSHARAIFAQRKWGMCTIYRHVDHDIRFGSYPKLRMVLSDQKVAPDKAPMAPTRQSQWLHWRLE